MPQIPTFVSDAPIETPQIGPRASPQQAAASAGLLAEGMARVAQSFGQVAQQVQEQSDSADALAGSGKLSAGLVELRAKFADDPDPKTAPARFKAEADTLLANTLAEAPNPAVRHYIGLRAARQMPIAYAEATTVAIKAQHAINISKFQSSLSDGAKLLGGAGSEADQASATAALQQAIAGAVANRWIRPDQAAGVLSGALRQAIALRATTDPLAAQRMMDAHKDQLDAADSIAIGNSLRAPVIRARGDAIAGAVTGSGFAAGTPPADADAAFDRMIGLESGGNQMDAQGNPLTSSAGAIGRAQVMPATGQAVAAAHGIAWDETKFRTDAAYNTKLGKLYFQDMLARYGGNIALASAAYNAGPGRVDQWIKSAGVGDPRTGAITDAEFAARIPIAETRKYVSRVIGAAYTPTTGDQIAEVKRRTSDPEVQRVAIAGVVHHAAELQQATAVERQQLIDDTTNLATAYQAGRVDADIPLDRIRRLLPPEQAAPLIDKLTVARGAGTLFRGVQYASPAEEAAARETLAVDPNAPPSDTLKLRLAESAEYDRMLKAKHDKLAADPAAYVAAAPGVAPPAGADPNDPDVARAAMARSLAMQAHMGVPEGKRRVLTNDQVAGIVTQLQGADPSKVDVGKQLAGLAGQFGPLWPQAFGELVQQGKLPRAYKLLAALDGSGQAAARADVQSMLVVAAQKGGMQAVRAATPPGTAAALKQALDDNGTLDRFRQTSRFDPGGTLLDGDIRQSTQDLAYYYMHRDGISASRAVDKAASAILDSKYDFRGTMRAPKGTMDRVAAAAAYVQGGLTPEDLAPRADPTGLRTPEEIRALTMRDAHRAIWAPNGPDDGLTLLYDNQNGRYTPVLRRDGSKVEIKFAALPTIDPAVVDQRATTRRTEVAGPTLRSQGFDPQMRNVPVGGVPMP